MPNRSSRTGSPEGTRAVGWCRTRWSCATLAATLQAKYGITASAETVRRWLHEIGWVWKQAKLVAKDDDPHRTERLARTRFHHDTLQAHEVMVFADELDIHLLPKVGAAWMLHGTQEEIITQCTNVMWTDLVCTTNVHMNIWSLFWYALKRRWTEKRRRS
jgi:hypothetical protein